MSCCKLSLDKASSLYHSPSLHEFAPAARGPVLARQPRARLHSRLYYVATDSGGVQRATLIKAAFSASISITDHAAKTNIQTRGVCPSRHCERHVRQTLDHLCRTCFSQSNFTRDSLYEKNGSSCQHCETIRGLKATLDRILCKH